MLFESTLGLAIMYVANVRAITKKKRKKNVAQTVKNPIAMREIWVQTLGWENPLEKGMATNSSILAWRIPWTEEPGRLWSQRVAHN